MAGGFAAFTLTDSLFLVKVADGSYQVGTIIDAGWLLAAVMISFAAWQPARHRAQPVYDGWRFVIMPSFFGLIAVALLVRDSTEYVIRPWTAVLAALTILGVFARFGVTFREYIHMVKFSRDEATTDALTNLGNRRKLLDDMQTAAERALVRGDVIAFGLFDLDGFKAYNDAYGHPAGDALLARLGARLAAAVAASGTAYRMGGDEFCVLVPCQRGAANATIARAAAAMTETGHGFSIHTSYGAVELPAETTEATEALRNADQRMYQQKQTRRAATGKEVSQTLMQALTEHSPGWDRAHVNRRRPGPRSREGARPRPGRDDGCPPRGRASRHRQDRRSPRPSWRSRGRSTDDEW